MTPRRHFLVMGFFLLAALAFASPSARAAQRVFATPDAAAQALNQAVRAGDRDAMTQVLGPGSAELIDSGDDAEDMVGRTRFAAAFEEAMRVEPRGARRAELVIGAVEWRFPFPLVHDSRGWRFDTRAGRDEVLARRIGRNELAAMQAVLAYVDAQREYALERHDGAGPGLYAQRIASAPGRHDGLYWTPTREDPLSPLGVMFTFAAADETLGGEAQPYHGYFFRVLRAQGPNATGGAMDYVAGGRMIGGFALVAYPARYRVSGVRTFIVNHAGLVYSRDLGARGASIARAMQRFDPGRPWRLEAEALVRAAGDERMRYLAGERGCTLCHRGTPATRTSADALPLAPSWREIAARYRGRGDAEETLTRVVLEGADPAERHWRDRAEFTSMGGNAPRASPDEARALVRWILSSP
jgi:cytochrome c551/c552